ncbi:nucleoside triphosphate pyrophosphohydrolase [Cereibacter changlensis]|uniref:nucleoside triphosphate pyrophosphohydrolase n=1 Tax=Cereibacter changlensis TaxID=402884 RepID=UPI004034AB13
MPFENRDFLLGGHIQYSQKFGVKAAGLMLLPKSWVPQWTALDLRFYDEWLQSGDLSKEAAERIVSWVATEGIDSLILRTSGEKESIKDRGKYQSIKTEGLSREEISRTICDIYARSKSIDPHDRMGIVAQRYVRPVLLGHLSNESRVSPTRNQWQYDLNDQGGYAKGLNSKFANSPNPGNPLVTRGSPHQLLRSIGHWCEQNSPVRCHLEWVTDEKNLYIIQLDLDWPELDRGVDPRITVTPSSPYKRYEGRLNVLKQFDIGSETRWKKLRNLSEFDFNEQSQAPRLYELDAVRFKEVSSNSASAKGLGEELRLVTSNRAVVRTEVDQEGFPRFNLPRTDTVTAEDALKWCGEALEVLCERGAQVENIAFLFHSFIPSLSSAWAYAEPGGNYAQVDALWGLPDGIQVLPHDSYEIVLAQNKIIPTKSTFKPMFLAEKDDGAWEYVEVLAAKGRSQVLSKSDIFEIARRTQEIANKIGETAQIMWFCQIPEELELGRNLPWFRSREFHQYTDTSKGQFREYVVRNHDDLNNAPTKQVALVYRPDPELIRSDDFLDLLIAVANRNGFPVKLYGSPLGHVYYRLSQARVPVILANSSRYERARERKAFGKLVRDLIPAKILSGGESVREAKLSLNDLPSALCGKMFEEAEEFLRAKERPAKIEELSDMFEIIRSLAEFENTSIDVVIAQADIKKERLGGFSLGRVLLETSLNSKGSKGERELPLVKLQELYKPTYEESEIIVPLASTLRTVSGGKLSLRHVDLDVSIQVSISGGSMKLKFIKLPSLAPAKGAGGPVQLSFLDDLSE